MSKKLVFSKDARNKLADGVDKLAEAVTATLGPAGRNVIIEQAQGNPISTKDGVTVAKAIELKDRVENIGAQIVKQAAIKTADQAGDGTTTSTLLAQAILSEGIDRMKSGQNAVDLKRGIDAAVKDVVAFIKENSKDITDEEQLKQVATISANNDTEVGVLISTAMDKVGRDGVVTIEESRTGETYLETVEGMQFSRGYKSPYFVTDNSSMQAVLQNPLVLITDKKLNQVKELLPILEACSSQNKNLLIIADDIGGEALSTLVVNKMRGNLGVVAVNAPEFGDRKKAVLEDIAVLTGATVISTERGMRLDKFQPEWFGEAKKVTVSKDSTTIIDAKGSEEAITARVEEIKTQIDDSKSPYETETLQDRLARFIGGVAIVYVGGHTEVEMKEKKDRVDDALHATKAALEEGILPGGGIALLNASIMLTEMIGEVPEEYQPGYDIVISSIERPFYKILSNGGYKNERIGDIEQEIKESGYLWSGYNPRTEEFVDMFNSGIIDPTKVTRLALENAASVAGTMLITEAVISNKTEKGPQNQIDPSMMM
jgi:chaperonin GroEL|tara:strand:+ start:3967 stop:5598 length:1632 start_codon:yes stop_codon:yes gene_type:complete